MFIVKIPWEKTMEVSSSPLGNEKALTLVSWKLTDPVKTGRVLGAGLTETEKDLETLRSSLAARKAAVAAATAAVQNPGLFSLHF